MDLELNGSRRFNQKHLFDMALSGLVYKIYIWYNANNLEKKKIDDFCRLF